MFNIVDDSIVMDVKVISPNCRSCMRFEADTILKEKMRMEFDPVSDEMKAIPDGYENALQCKYYEECKHIFEEGYNVVKEQKPDYMLEIHSEDIKKIEKKPVTRKPRTTKSTKKTMKAGK